MRWASKGVVVWGPLKMRRCYETFLILMKISLYGLHTKVGMLPNFLPYWQILAFCWIQRNFHSTKLHAFFVSSFAFCAEGGEWSQVQQWLLAEYFLQQLCLLPAQDFKYASQTFSADMIIELMLVICIIKLWCLSWIHHYCHSYRRCVQFINTATYLQLTVSMNVVTHNSISLYNLVDWLDRDNFHILDREQIWLSIHTLKSFLFKYTWFGKYEKFLGCYKR